jgi:hypothetical protein
LRSYLGCWFGNGNTSNNKESSEYGVERDHSGGTKSKTISYGGRERSDAAQSRLFDIMSPDDLPGSLYLQISSEQPVSRDDQPKTPYLGVCAMLPKNFQNQRPGTRLLNLTVAKVIACHPLQVLSGVSRYY